MILRFNQRALIIAQADLVSVQKSISQFWLGGREMIFLRKSAKVRAVMNC